MVFVYFLSPSKIQNYHTVGSERPTPQCLRLFSLKTLQYEQQKAPFNCLRIQFFDTNREHILTLLIVVFCLHTFPSFLHFLQIFLNHLFLNSPLIFSNLVCSFFLLSSPSISSVPFYSLPFPFVANISFPFHPDAPIFSPFFSFSSPTLLFL